VRAVALLGAAALAAGLVAGCGGKSDKKANEQYANSVCTALGKWEQQIRSIATNLSGGISKSTLQSKATQAENATRSLASEIKSIPPPDTSEGQAAKQQLEQLSTDTTNTVDAVKSAIDGLQAGSSASTITAALITLAPQVQSLASTAKSTVSSLQEAKGGLSSAFKSSSECKSLGG
jgi:hypothetical protein